MRGGRAPSGASRQTWLLLPIVGAQLPRPQSGGRSAPPTPGDFPVAEKVTKGAPKPTVLDSLGAGSPPFSRSLTHRAGLPSATKIDRFATLSLWANRSCFFLWFHQGNTLCFQSVARQVGCPEDAAGSILPQPIPLGHKAGGSKGATPPSPEVQEPGGSW